MRSRWQVEQLWLKVWEFEKTKMVEMTQMTVGALFKIYDQHLKEYSLRPIIETRNNSIYLCYHGLAHRIFLLGKASEPLAWPA